MKYKDFSNILLSGIAIQLILFIPFIYTIDAQQQELRTIPRDRIDLSVSNLSAGWTDSGNVFIMGKVVNNSTFNVEDVIVDVSIFDKNDELINKDNRFIIPPSSILEKGFEQEFRFFIIAENAYSYNVSSFGSKSQ